MRLIDLVIANPDKPWDWARLSYNPNITLKDVLANPDKPWRWYWLSRNPNITPKDVFANPGKTWDWAGLSWNRFGYKPEIYNKERIQERTAVIKDELIAVAWEPTRIASCIDVETRAEWGI
jgi:hypothetical protein